MTVLRSPEQTLPRPRTAVQFETEDVTSLQPPLYEAVVLDYEEVATSIPLFSPEDADYTKPVRVVKGLRSINCVRSCLTQLPTDERPRIRRTVEVELDSSLIAARITEPDPTIIDNANDAGSVILFHGFTEIIDGGTGRDLHNALAPHFPDRRLISIATDGVGLHCSGLEWAEGWAKNFPEMAEARHRVIAALAGRGALSLVSVSMGTVITSELLKLDASLQGLLDENTGEAQSLPIDAVIYHSHAQVPFSRVLPDMVARFLPHMLRDVRRMAQRVPGHAHETRLGPTAKVIAKSLPAFAGNIRNLFRGTRPQDMYANASSYQTAYISGELDPLRQPKLLKQLAAALPESVMVYMKPDVGHAACFDAKDAAQDIADMHSLLTNTALRPRA